MTLNEVVNEILATKKNSIVLNSKETYNNQEVRMLLKAVRRNPNIINVILRYNDLSSGSGGLAVVNMIKKSESIVNLDISNNKIDDCAQDYIIFTSNKSDRKINITFDTEFNGNCNYNYSKAQYLLHTFRNAPSDATVCFAEELSSSSKSSDTEMEEGMQDPTKWKAIMY